MYQHALPLVASSYAPCVYYIYRRDGAIRIGYTENLCRRLGEHAEDWGVVVLLAYEVGPKALEKERLRQFDHLKVMMGSEDWFTPHPDLLEHISNLQDWLLTELEGLDDGNVQLVLKSDALIYKGKQYI